jgi:hypothetical protein
VTRPRKFTDTELSCILSEHSIGNVWCLSLAAGLDSCTDGAFQYGAACVALWEEDRYDPFEWTHTQLLRALEKAGLA